jgi:TRAP-type C4-dicarboxylate transport system substrate-binding protein
MNFDRDLLKRKWREYTYNCRDEEKKGVRKYIQKLQDQQVSVIYIHPAGPFRAKLAKKGGELNGNIGQVEKMMD